MASMALISTTSFGQEEGDAGTTELSPLSITGAKAATIFFPVLRLKTSLPVDSLPKSVSIMDADQIKAQGLKSVGRHHRLYAWVINSQGEDTETRPLFVEFAQPRTSTATEFVTAFSTIVRFITLNKSKSSAV